uniref:Uncharacterized protein n=1 Tax=Sphaerodactylus townsendi TaxID=933632 RepID=A0ACB8ETG6_9SAUR
MLQSHQILQAAATHKRDESKIWVTYMVLLLIQQNRGGGHIPLLGGGPCFQEAWTATYRGVLRPSALGLEECLASVFYRALHVLFILYLCRGGVASSLPVGEHKGQFIPSQQAGDSHPGGSKRKRRGGDHLALGGERGRLRKMCSASTRDLLHQQPRLQPRRKARVRREEEGGGGACEARPAGRGAAFSRSLGALSFRPSAAFPASWLAGEVLCLPLHGQAGRAKIMVPELEKATVGWKMLNK